MIKLEAKHSFENTNLHPLGRKYLNKCLETKLQPFKSLDFYLFSKILQKKKTLHLVETLPKTFSLF